MGGGVEYCYVGFFRGEIEIGVRGCRLVFGLLMFSRFMFSRKLWYSLLFLCCSISFSFCILVCMVLVWVKVLGEWLCVSFLVRWLFFLNSVWYVL